MGLTCLSVFREAPERAVNDVSIAHIWGISSVQALKMAMLKYRRAGTKVEVVGLNAASETIFDRLGIHGDPRRLLDGQEQNCLDDVTHDHRAERPVRRHGPHPCLRPRHPAAPSARMSPSRQARSMAHASGWPDPDRDLRSRPRPARSGPVEEIR